VLPWIATAVRRSIGGRARRRLCAGLEHPPPFLVQREGMKALRYSAVVLAAGTSTRMAGRHKLLLPLGDETVIRRTVRAVLDAGPEEVVVVTGFNEHAVRAALDGLGARFETNPRYEAGQMTSVAAGVAALTAPRDAVMVCLGDMALLESSDYAALVQAYATRPRGSILVPQRDGMRGNPVLFAESLVSEAIAGNRNFACRKLIADYPEEVYPHDPGHDRCFVDLDTPEDYAQLLARMALPAAGAAPVS
jgi:molybdenum cofactor cytidylyltransferase